MKDTALMVVDVQKLITIDALYNFNAFRESLAKLIAEARSSGTEVIYVRHDGGKGSPLTKGNEGHNVADFAAPKADEKIFDKTVNSPFRDSGLLEYLRSKGIKKLIVTGLQTDYCIDATVKCGFDHGFEIIVPENCNTTFTNNYMTGEQTYHYYNDFMWKNRYAKCTTMAETLEMLQNDKYEPKKY